VAAFLRDSTVRRIVTLAQLDLLAPEFVQEEVSHHLPELRRRAGLSLPAAMELLSLLEEYLTLIPAEALLATWGQASAAMAEIDPKDTAYLAAALAMGTPLWSDDPHLTKQTLVPCWTTRALLAALRKDGLRV